MGDDEEFHERIHYRGGRRLGSPDLASVGRRRFVADPGAHGGGAIARIYGHDLQSKSVRAFMVAALVGDSWKDIAVGYWAALLMPWPAARQDEVPKRSSRNQACAREDEEPRKKNSREDDASGDRIARRERQSDQEGDGISKSPKA